MMMSSQIVPAHFEPLCIAAKNGANVLYVQRGKLPVRVVPGKPTIAVVGDDLYDAQGPDAFNRNWLQKFVAGCRCGVIVSGAPELRAYMAAAAPTMMGFQTILIETRPKQVIPWIKFIRDATPGMKLILSAVKGGNG